MKSAQYPSLDSSVAAALAALPAPAKPVSGRGYDRFPINEDLTNRTIRELWEAVPERHRYECRFGGVRRYVSPEAFVICKPVIQAVRELREARKPAAPAMPERLPLPAVQRNREAPIVVNAANLAASRLTEAEQAEVSALLNGAHHPVTGRALQLKIKSGLSWAQIQQASQPQAAEPAKAAEVAAPAVDWSEVGPRLAEAVRSLLGGGVFRSDMSEEHLALVDAVRDALPSA